MKGEEVMEKIEFIYDTYLQGSYSSIEDVVVDREDEKIIMKIYAVEDITVVEIQRLIDDYKKLFDISLEFVKYEKIPFVDRCLIEFEVNEYE